MISPAVLVLVIENRGRERCRIAVRGLIERRIVVIVALMNLQSRQRISDAAMFPEMEGYALRRHPHRPQGCHLSPLGYWDHDSGPEEHLRLGSVGHGQPQCGLILAPRPSRLCWWGSGLNSPSAGSLYRLFRFDIDARSLGRVKYGQGGGEVGMRLLSINVRDRPLYDSVFGKARC